MNPLGWFVGLYLGLVLAHLYLTDPHPWWYLVHNVVAHPLLILCPPLGERFHQYTGDRL